MTWLIAVGPIITGERHRQTGFRSLRAEFDREQAVPTANCPKNVYEFRTKAGFRNWAVSGKSVVGRYKGKAVVQATASSAQLNNREPPRTLQCGNHGVGDHSVFIAVAYDREGLTKIAHAGLRCKDGSAACARGPVPGECKSEAYGGFDPVGARRTPGEVILIEGIQVEAVNIVELVCQVLAPQ